MVLPEADDNVVACVDSRVVVETSVAPVIAPAPDMLIDGEVTKLL